LIDLGADPTHKNADGYTAESYAGKFAQIIALRDQQIAINQQRAAQAQKNKDSGGSFGGSILDVLGAIGAGGL
jgi:hypothetical protein